MKRIIVLLFVLTLSYGCSIGPYHSNLKGYQSGRFGGWATNEEAFNLESQLITLEAYKKRAAQQKDGQTTTTGAESAEFEGGIVNNSNYTIEFILTGPVKRTFYVKRRTMEPKTHTLPAGVYEARTYYRSQLNGWRTVNVNVLEEKYYQGKKYTWLLVFN